MADTTHWPASASGDLTGKQLAGYQVLRRLGRGAMADVYLAQQQSLDRQVALKVLHAALAGDESYVRRFQFEAQSAARLVHPAIVQVYEVGQDGPLHFIAQEYVPGMNLAQLLAREGPPPLARTLSILRQVASALAKAGHHGIVHRDIKPENIMLASTGEVKVADFGLARLAGDTALNLTQTGYTLGTPLYMSPEQVEGRTLDPRSDMYSFGVTTYHMLAGHAPFRGESALSVAVQHLRTQPERLENVRPDLPPALCRIVHKMMAKQPEDRYGSGGELLEELKALAGAPPGEHEHESNTFVPLAQPSELTQKLSTAMRRTTSIAREARPWRAVAVWTAAAFAAGMGLAWIARPTPLLPPQVSAAADLKPSAQEQFEYARRIDTEAGWQSVPMYYPQQRELALEAQQQLARWYIDQQRFADALRVFEELAATPGADQRLRAFALLGQALTLGLENRPAEARRRMEELRPLRPQLPQREAATLMAQVLAQKGRPLPPEIRAQLQWLRRPGVRPGGVGGGGGKGPARN